MPWCEVPSSPTSPARSTARSTGRSFWQTSWTVWSKARCRNVEYSATTGRIPPIAMPLAIVTACCSAMPTSWKRFGKAAWNLERPVPGGHPGRDRHDPPIRPRELDELGHEDGGVARVLRGARGRRRREGVAVRTGAVRASGPDLGRLAGKIGGSRARAVECIRAGREVHRRQGRAVEGDLVGLGGPVAAALLCPNVDEDRALQLEDARERRQQRMDVVARDDAEVGDPEVLEQLARAREVDDRAAQALAPHHGRRPDDRDRAPEAGPRRTCSSATHRRA